MEVEKIAVSMFLSVLLASCFLSTVAIDYLDTDTLIVRQLPNDQRALFGYSAVLHSLDPNGSIDNIRLVVGAPLQEQPSNDGSTQPTGALYSCRLLENQCDRLNSTNFYTFDDTTEFEINENRTQLLGISLHSTGDRFVACAPRLRTDLTGSQMPGRCFFGNRSLQNFTEREYCYDSLVNDRIFGPLFRVCNIGASTTGSLPESGENTFVFGMPTFFAGLHLGSFLFTTINDSGIHEQSQCGEPDGGSVLLSLCANRACEDSYDGYAVSVGRITSTTRLDVITSRPRYGGQNITGLVTVTSNFPGPNFPGIRDGYCSIYSSILYGSISTEYFGWSLVALDLTGDGYDELLVGAPLYSYTDGPLNCLDCGRVYVYRNTETRTLEFEKRLLGRIPFGRFGYAMTSVGDINHDGCDDFVISAPLSRTGSDSGTIYLYLGAGPSVLVADTPTQRIIGNELNSLASVVSFGSSLSSGYDLDSNGFTDLVVGAGFNETVVVLRARPLFLISTNMTSSSFSVSFTNPNCHLNGLQNGSLPLDGICFDVTFEITDARKSITTEYELRYTLTADDQAQEPLLFVEPTLQQNVLTDSITFGPSSNRTITRTIYAGQSETVVSRNSLITLNIMLNDSNSGSVPETLAPTILPDPTSIKNLAVFLNGSTGCFASSSCQNDLHLEVDVTAPRRREGNSSVLIIDDTRTVIVTIGFINVENASCIQTYVNYSTDVFSMFTDVNQIFECVDNLCFADVPAGRNEVDITFEFTTQPSYPEDPAFITFNATSGCTEVNDTDNMVTLSFVPRRLTNLTTTIEVNPVNGVFEAISEDLVDISDAFNLDRIDVTFTVGNDGPSSSPYAKLVIYWPLMDPEGPAGQFFLYPTRIDSPSASCSMEHIDPENLNLRRKRQSTADTLEDDLMETWDCSSDQKENCAMITCDINTTLSRSESISITITTRYDLRTLSRRAAGRNYVLRLGLFAEVDSDDHFYGPSNSTGIFELRSLPAEILPPEDDDSIPIWIIIVAIIVAILIIIVFGIILYCCGFCRRKKRDEEGDEETQKWVTASGTATPDLSRENSMRSRTLTDENRSSKINDNHNDENANKKEDSVASEDHDEKSSPPEKTDEKKIPLENNEQKVEPESKKEIAPVESDVNNAATAEENTPPDTHIGSDNDIPLETTGTGEGTDNTTTVELACEETDL